MSKSINEIQNDQSQDSDYIKATGVAAYYTLFALLFTTGYGIWKTGKGLRALFRQISRKQPKGRHSR